MTVAVRFPTTELRLETQPQHKRRVERPCAAIARWLRIAIRWITVHVTRRDSKPQATDRSQRAVEGQREAEPDAEPSASLAVECKRRPDLEEDRLQQEICELVPSLLVEEEQRRKEWAKVYAEEEVLAGVRTPAPGKHDAGHVRDQETGFAHHVRVCFAVEPGRARSGAQGERQPPIPAAIEPIAPSLRARRAGKRRKDKDRADDHP